MHYSVRSKKSYASPPSLAGSNSALGLDRQLELGVWVGGLELPASSRCVATSTTGIAIGIHESEGEYRVRNNHGRPRLSQKEYSASFLVRAGGNGLFFRGGTEGGTEEEDEVL